MARKSSVTISSAVNSLARGPKARSAIASYVTRPERRDSVISRYTEKSLLAAMTTTNSEHSSTPLLEKAYGSDSAEPPMMVATRPQMALKMLAVRDESSNPGTSTDTLLSLRGRPEAALPPLKGELDVRVVPYEPLDMCAVRLRDCKQGTKAIRQDAMVRQIWWKLVEKAADEKCMNKIARAGQNLRDVVHLRRGWQRLKNEGMQRKRGQQNFRGLDLQSHVLMAGF